jgi:hypothetical protein
MKFNPNTGKPMLVCFTPQEFCEAFPYLAWRYDPATGRPQAFGDDPPINPATARPYFTIPAHGWGAGWTAGRFYAHPLNEPLPRALGTPEEIAEGLAWVESLRAASTPPTPAAPDILTAAAKHMTDRAKTYDKPGGERSMGQTVTAFNAITGRDLQESEGWLLMQILKDVRDRQRAEPHVDSLEDGVAYAALKAEARIGGR